MTVNTIKAVLAFSALVLLCLSCNTYLNTKTEEFASADFLGMVYDADNQACPGVRISLDGAAGPLSDVNGRFVLPNVSRGKHTIKATKEFYEEADFTIMFSNRTQVVYLKIFSLGQILAKAEEALANRKLSEADGFLTRASKIDNADPQLLFLRASLALKRETPSEAATLLQTIIDHHTAEPVVYLALADIYQYKLNDTARALAYLKKYAQLAENTEVQSRIKKLELSE